MSGLTSQHIAPGTHESMPEVALSSTRQLAPGVSLPVTCVHFVASHASPPSEAYAAHLRPSAHFGAHGSQAAPSPPPVVLLLALPSSALVSPDRKVGDPSRMARPTGERPDKPRRDPAAGARAAA